MKGKKKCASGGAISEAGATMPESEDNETTYKAGGKVKAGAGSGVHRMQMEVEGGESKRHLGRGIRGKFAMGGVVKHSTDPRCD